MISLSNKNKYILYVKKMKFMELLSFLVFIIPILLPTLIQFFHAPSFVKYTVDFFIVVLLFIIIINRRLCFERLLLPFLILFASVFLLCFIVYVFNYQSVFYFLWGCRNNFRFYIAFLAYILFLEEDDISSMLKSFDVLFWINAVVSLYQYFVLGYNQDYLGGIFGVEKGCNSTTLLFFSVFIAKTLIMYMQGNEKNYVCFIKCAVTLIISAMAELKMFFLLFAIILLFTIIFTKFSWKKVIFVLGAFGLLSLSNILLERYVDSGISIESIIKLMTATSYSSGNDIGRFSAISIISEQFHTGIFDKLFGMGLGNCDTSNFAICNTPFFEAHNELHYTWFSTSFLYLETGFVGLVLISFVFVLCFILAYRKWKSGNCNELYCKLGMVMAIVCFIVLFYNSSLRMDIGYMVYFILALPFVSGSEKPIEKISDISAESAV